MFLIGIICCIIGLGFFGYSFVISKNTKQINHRIEKENNELDHHNKYLLSENKRLEEKQIDIIGENKKLEEKRNSINEIINIKQEELSNLQNNISKTVDNQKELSQKAFESYCEVLDNQYKEAEDEYDQYKDAMETSYSNLQLKLLKETEEIREELDKFRATRAAAIQAHLKEKEIEENFSFYCLQVSNNDLKDIAILESIKPKLINDRILSMLIWQTYYRTSMTNLCNNVIGKESKTGIYKITNQLTKECYIGQAVDIAERWKQHAKCGLGIDTPQKNKLYKAMQEYGIQNFSWEVIEFCPKAQLDEKERYYIQLYQSKEYGYNTLAGITKN